MYTKVTKKVLKSLVNNDAAEDVSTYTDAQLIQLKYDEGYLKGVLASWSQYHSGYTGVIAVGMNTHKLYYFDGSSAMACGF